MAEAGVFATADDVSALATAIRAAMRLDRRIPAARARRLFNQPMMLEAYEDLYGWAIAGYPRHQ